MTYGNIRFGHILTVQESHGDSDLRTAGYCKFVWINFEFSICLRALNYNAAASTVTRGWNYFGTTH